VEVVYGITSLRPEQADAARLLGLVWVHWRIENSLHYVRDVTLGEDACRVRRGSAPQVLAALRNAAVRLLSGLGAGQPGGGHPPTGDTTPGTSRFAPAHRRQ
jgi:hypothetical protein